MLLSEQIQLKKSEDLSNLCHLAKNLYNHANYLVRHRYFFLLNPDRLDFKWLKELKDDLISKCSNVSNISHITKKYVEIKNNLIHKYNKISGKQGYGGIGKFMSYQELWALMKYTPTYNSLPAQSAQSILLLVENDWRSYFKRKDAYYKAKNELPFEEFKKRFNSIPKIPKYKNKNGESIIIFTNQQCRIENRYLIFPKKSHFKNATPWHPSIKTRLNCRIKQVRIIPKGIGYKLEIVYEKEAKDLNFEKTFVLKYPIQLTYNLIMIIS